MDKKTIIDLADWRGPSVPWRYHYPSLRASGSRLDGDVSVAAAVIAQISDKAVLGASSTFGCNAAQVMVAG
jgi:hypothetical protein